MDSRTLKLKTEYPTYLNQLNTVNVRLGPWVTVEYFCQVLTMWKSSLRGREFDSLALNLHRQESPIYEMKDAWAILAKKEVSSCYASYLVSFQEWNDCYTSVTMCECPQEENEEVTDWEKPPPFPAPQDWKGAGAGVVTDRAELPWEGSGGTHHLQTFSCSNYQQLSQTQQ